MIRTLFTYLAMSNKSEMEKLFDIKLRITCSAGTQSNTYNLIIFSS